MHKACDLYAHITWRTWRRIRAVTRKDVPVLIRAVNDAAQRTSVRVHSIEVLKDHLHVVVSYLPTVAIANFIRDAKSESSRRVNQQRAGEGALRWGRGYYVGSLSDSHVRRARNYVGLQYQRHPDLIPD